MYKEFVDALKQEIEKGLPGWEAQKQMAPLGRDSRLYLPETKEGSKESGVLLWLYPANDKVYARLIVRTEGGVHSGQVAFPGGKFEKQDETFWNTALREANEEIGVDSSKITKVGALSPLYIPPSNFWVHPFIGTSEMQDSLSISKGEVQSYFDIDVLQLIQPQFKTEALIKRGSGGPITTPCYILNGHTVWGATAMILSELEELTNRSLLKMNRSLFNSTLRKEQ